MQQTTTAPFASLSDNDIHERIGKSLAAYTSYKSRTTHLVWTVCSFRMLYDAVHAVCDCKSMRPIVVRYTSVIFANRQRESQKTAPVEPVKKEKHV